MVQGSCFFDERSDKVDYRVHGNLWLMVQGLQNTKGKVYNTAVTQKKSGLPQ